MHFTDIAIFSQEWGFGKANMRLLVVKCAAHKLNPGLSSSVGLSCSVCQEKINCCFQFVSWNLTCLHVELSLANVDKGIANSVCKTF